MGWLRPSYAAVAGVLLVLAATGITLGVKAGSHSKTGISISAARARNTIPSGVCEQLSVPAYFNAQYWIQAIRSKHPPADMILDISGVGAGTKPEASMLYLVKKAQAAGITVLGYSSTAGGARPIAQVEADVRNYASWYGVTSIFLDVVKGTTQEFSYYKTIADYIHAAHPGDQVWMNPGVYPPDQGFMSIGDVMMVFEGTYAQYLTAKVPSWAIDYPAARFAYTIFATPKAVLTKALDTAELRAAGHIFVTDLVGSNPYIGLPSYWSTEDTDATAGCRPGSG